MLLIDFPADTYTHCLNNNIKLAKIKNCLITHTHLDHLYLDELFLRKPVFSNLPAENILTFYGLPGAMQKINEELDATENEMVKTKALTPYIRTQIGEYTVTALNALHDPSTFPAFYIIEDKSGKTILYAHDTGYFIDEVWEYFKNNEIKFDLVSLDCTEANRPATDYLRHMGLNANVKVKNKLIEMNCADEKTVFISNHFSHNASDVLYEEFS